MNNAARKSGKTSARGRKAAKTTKPASPPPPAEPVAIVGIGASAGGLEAITQFLKALPPDTGMAFVFVQHLEPRHESMLSTLLQRATQMPVAEVKAGTRVQSNHLYVIPANADIGIAGGVLGLARRKALMGQHLPIDHFFRSLAQDQGARAIGVILSGTASDGTLGMKAIKVEGGITFAQDPETARFDGMPTSAISAGCVDFVLPPQRIATELEKIGRHPYVGLSRSGEDAPVLPARDEDFLRVFKLLKASFGVDFTFYKKPTIQRRIARRMALHSLEKLSDYVKYLESNSDEADALYQDILIHVTSFFREPEVFRAFQTRLLPRVTAAKTPGEPVRLWCAGCSTGEEAYSLAICLLEYLGDKTRLTPVQLFGTDISEQAIEKARLGIYPADALSQVGPGRLRRFFTKIDGNYQINSSVRDLCVFARHDLTKDPPFSRLDIIACRNVLIYLEPVLQKRVLASFHYALKDSGFLMLGKSETLGGFPDLFSLVDRKAKFFSKKAAAGVAYQLGAAAFEPLRPRGKRHVEEPPHFDLEREADRLVWEHYEHSGLVVNNDLQILHFRGDTSPYLRPAPGKATFNLLRMLRDELVFEVRAAIQKVRRNGLAVRRDAIVVKHNGSSRHVNVEVRPLPGPATREKYFLILFDEENRTVEPPPEPRKRSKSEDRQLLKLKNELAHTREYLQSIIQEQESTNEELKTANEEALSSMEELQSANEELETAKEELQSTNEELVTLNEQLVNRNTELTRLGDDLSNVLNNTNIPILMLGGDRRIRRFNPSAEKLLHLLAGDIGRPLADIRVPFQIPDLDLLISSVIDRGSDVQRDVAADTGRWYSLRFFPFRTSERKVDGVLIAFVDIHELKQSQEALQSEMNLTSAILNASANDLLVVVADREARIVRFNRACQEFTGYTAEEVKGKRIWDFLVLPDEVSAAKASFDEVRRGTPNRREYYWLAKDGGRRLIAWSNSIARGELDVEYIVATGIDVTERQEAKEQARALMESAPQAVLGHREKGRITLANSAAETMFGYSRQELTRLTIDELLPRNRRREHARHRAGWSSNPEVRPMGLGLDINGRRKDGSEFPVKVGLSHIETKEGMLAVSIVSDLTDREKAETALIKYRRELTARLLSIQEAETRLLARELHDDLTQKLAALGMETSALAKSATRSPASLAGRIQDLGQKISGLSDDIHRMSRRLHPAILDDLGLEAALREECLSSSRRLGIPVQFQADGVPRSLPGDVALCLFRVAQESLSNIAKHAKAKDVRMILARHDSELVLLVEDAGRGFNIDEVRGKGGLGLVSMEERVRLVHGDFSISSHPGKGTEIEVHVPLKEAAAAP